MKQPTPENAPSAPGFTVEVVGDKLLLSVPVVHELTIEEANLLQDELGRGKLKAIFNRMGLPLREDKP